MSLTEQHLTTWVGDKAENTLRQWSTHLEEWEEWLDVPVQEAEWEHLDEYLKSMKGEYAPNTIKSRYGSLRRFYNELERRDHIDESPFEPLTATDYTETENRKHAGDDGSRPVDADEVEALCEHAPIPEFRNEVIFRFMFDTGVRESELANLRVDDLDLENRTAFVWSSKTKEERTVFYSSNVRLLLKKWLHKYRNVFKSAEDSEYVFNSRRSENLRPENVGYLVKEAADRAGIQEVMYHDAAGNPRNKITAHSLRSGFAVRALKAGVDIRSVQKQLGHADIEQTMTYLKYTDSDVKEQFDSRLF